MLISWPGQTTGGVQHQPRRNAMRFEFLRFDHRWLLVLSLAMTLMLIGLLPQATNAKAPQAATPDRSRLSITVRRCDTNLRNCTSRTATYPTLSANIKREVDKALTALPKHDSQAAACQWVGGGNKWVLVCSLIDKQGSCGCVFWEGGSACTGDHPGCPK